MTKKGRKSVF